MPLDEKIRDRIFNEAKAYARKHGRKEIGYYMLNYEAGATAEAEKAAGMVEALEKIKDITGGPVMPSHMLLNQLYKFAETALTKYNNSK